MVIFHSYVSLPEGRGYLLTQKRDVVIQPINDNHVVFCSLKPMNICFFCMENGRWGFWPAFHHWMEWCTVKCPIFNQTQVVLCRLWGISTWMLTRQECSVSNLKLWPTMVTMANFNCQVVLLTYAPIILCGSWFIIPSRCSMCRIPATMWAPNITHLCMELQRHT